MNGISTTAPQSVDNETNWNNFPIGTPYSSKAGIGQQLDRGDLEKYVIDIDANRKEQFVKDLPISKLFEAMNVGGSVSDFVVTWAGLYKNSAQTESMPNLGLRTRNAHGMIAAKTDWGTGAGTGTDVAIPVANPNEFGGKLQWQRVYADVAASGNVNSVADLTADLVAGDTVTFSSSQLHKFTSTFTGQDGKVSGIIGEMKEGAPVLAENGKHIMAYGMRRNSDDIKRTFDDYIRKFAALLQQMKYVQSTVATVTFASETIAAATTKGDVTDASSTAIEFKYVEGTSMMAHPFFELLTMKLMDDIMPTPNIIMGIEKFVFSADLKSFYIVFDLFNSNIRNLKRLDASYKLTTNVAVDGAYYVVSEGLVSIGNIDYTPGQIFQATGTVDIATGSGAVYPAWDGFLLEEINTARYSVTAPTQAGAAPTEQEATDIGRNNFDRMFAPGLGGAPLGWTRHFNQIETTLDYNMIEETASANGSFNLNNMESGSQNIEHDGKNFVEIFRSKVWMKTREEQLGKVRHGRNTQIDEERAMRKFYKGIEMKLLFGKLNFATEITGLASNLQTPDQLFATTDATSDNLYNITRGFDGDYKGSMSGMFDKEVFNITWGRLPFTMSKPGFDPRRAADKGFALIEYCETVASALSYGDTEGGDRQYSVMLAPSAINAMGLIYAKNSSIVSETGNPFGSEIIFNSASDKKNPDLKFDTFQYRASTGAMLTFIPTPAFDFSPKFKGSHAMLGKKYLDPRWLMLVLDKNNIRVSSHEAYPEQEFVGLQPNHNVNIELRGIQGSRTLEMDNAEEMLIIDMSPTESDIYLTN